jgi:hypothetical protein
VTNLVVILGAGASFDSIDTTTTHADEHFRPPLTAELFSGSGTRGQANADVMRRYRQCTGLVQVLRRCVASGENVEDLLARYVASADDNDLIELSALRFYIRDVIGFPTKQWADSARNATNVHHLAHRVERWRRRGGHPAVTYITFDYDTMIEDALASLGLLTLGPSVDRLIQGESARVVKVHGSVDWFRPLPFTSSRPPLEMMIDRFNEIAPKLADANEIVRYETKDFVDDHGRLLYPAISVPVTDKDVFECPSSHLEVARNALWAAHDILVIGWRAGDRQFLSKWHEWRNFPPDRRPAQQFLIVAGHPNENPEIFQRIAGALTDAGLSVEDPKWKGFSHFMRSDALEKFLG